MLCACISENSFSDPVRSPETASADRHHIPEHVKSDYGPGPGGLPSGQPPPGGLPPGDPPPGLPYPGAVSVNPIADGRQATSSGHDPGCVTKFLF